MLERNYLQGYILLFSCKKLLKFSQLFIWKMSVKCERTANICIHFLQSWALLECVCVRVCTRETSARIILAIWPKCVLELIETVNGLDFYSIFLVIYQGVEWGATGLDNSDRWLLYSFIIHSVFIVCFYYGTPAWHIILEGRHKVLRTWGMARNFIDTHHHLALTVYDLYVV